MAITTINTTNNEQKETPFMAEAVFAVEEMNSNTNKDKQHEIKQLLDTLFPLAKGSHQDVTNYLLDYHHLVVFFKDGGCSGLLNPGKFVAFTGHRSSPDRILLKDNSGSHVEIVFGHHESGKNKLVTIDDIEMETCTTFSQDFSLAAMRYWISLLKRDDKSQPKARQEDKDYTAKNGGDYQLACCFSL
ncbi:malate synthase [Aliivibrio logei]|uniref:Malate synthase n=2 Tax=Aliivibrio logei TaxID=688 RepID=A0A1B9NWJ3_ALILO|nr:malate synthase [Aliivibrio logei]OCH19573.1 malate synthase [Aliivibrio logei]OEF18856.1 malate synthase [Aliivibrio logei 5S-186]